MTTNLTNSTNKVPNVPPLRFPEFTEEWEKCELGDIMLYSKERIPTNTLSDENYVSTENMLPNFGGKCRANGLPTNGSAIVYQTGDILLSNIRPYLKKVWLAKNNGGCSTDVFVLKANQEKCNSDYLHYIIASDNFIDYVMSGAKGIKMPRGDKEQIKKYRLSIPTPNEQCKIAALLSKLDTRIETQNKIIQHLESLIKGIVVTHFNQCRNKQVITISDLGTAYSVGNLSKEDLSEYGEPCILYGELFTTYGCVAHNIISRTNKYEQATLSQINDLLFPASTTVDAVSLIAPTSIQTHGVYVAGDMFGIHIQPQYDSQYISYLLNFVYNKELAKYAQGSTIIHLHYSDIKRARILVPLLDEQKKCNQLLATLQKKLAAESLVLQMYQSQKQYLLQQMFI